MNAGRRSRAYNKHGRNPRKPRLTSLAHAPARERALRFAHPARERHEEAAGDARRLVEQLLEARAPDDQEPQGALRHHRRRAWLAVEQAHLAEVLAGAEPDLPLG